MKSPCYLLPSVVFAADPVLYLFFLWERFLWTPWCNNSVCRGRHSRWAGNLLLSVPGWGSAGAGLEGDRALSFGLLCFLQQSSHRELVVWEDVLLL